MKKSYIENGVLILIHLVILVFGIFISEFSFAENSCPDRGSINKVFTKGGIYIGEAHGTNESPNFVSCLVTTSIESIHTRKIIVSLEMPNKARNLNSSFWYQRDGRSSFAMWEFVKKMIKYEDDGLISLHFQYGDGIKFKNQQELEEKLAQSIHTQLDKGFVIIYGGNFHSGMAISSFLPNLKPAGMFLDGRVIHLAIGSSLGGTLWACSPECEEMKLPPISKLTDKEDHLIDGAPYFHDFMYVLKSYTSSPPKFVLE